MKKYINKIILSVVIIASIIFMGIVIINAISNAFQTTLTTVPKTEITSPPVLLENTSDVSWENTKWIQIPLEDITEIKIVETANNGDINWEYGGVKLKFQNGTLTMSVGKKLNLTGSINGMFSDLENLKKISGLNLIDVEYVTDISNLFKNCSSLEEIAIYGWNTKRVTNASSMFEGCISLNSADLSSLDFSEVANMSRIFLNCPKLYKIFLPTTKNIQDLTSAFENVGISAKTKAYINGELNTEFCTKMDNMFYKSAFANYEIVEKFNTKSLVSATNMLSSCGLIAIDLSNWDTKNVENIEGMFSENPYLENCIINNWNMGSLYNCRNLFLGCSKIKEINFTWKNVEDITFAEKMFANCYSLEKINMVCFVDTRFGDISYMFENCEKLQSIGVSQLHADVSDFFLQGCYALIPSEEYPYNLQDAINKGVLY